MIFGEFLFITLYWAETDAECGHLHTREGGGNRDVRFEVNFEFCSPRE